MVWGNVGVNGIDSWLLASEYSVEKSKTGVKRFCRILTAIRLQWNEFVLGLFHGHWMLIIFWDIKTEVFKTHKPGNFHGKSV
jgi:hypothetical protein